jgi:hypothetical protein
MSDDGPPSLGFATGNAMQYLAPGGLIVIDILAIWVAAAGPTSGLRELGVASVFFFIFASYVLGMVVHLGATAIGRRKRQGAFPGIRMLDQGDGTLSSEFKGNLRDQITSDFDIDLSTPAKREENGSDAFDLCYAWLKAQGRAGASLRHETDYLMLRNLQLAAAVTLLLGVTLGLQLLSSSLDGSRQNSMLWQSGSVNWIAIGIAMLFVLTSTFFVSFAKQRLAGLYKRFCASVYQTYYAVRCVQ